MKSGYSIVLCEASASWLSWNISVVPEGVGKLQDQQESHWIPIRIQHIWHDRSWSNAKAHGRTEHSRGNFSLSFNLLFVI